MPTVTVRDLTRSTRIARLSILLAVTSCLAVPLAADSIQFTVARIGQTAAGDPLFEFNYSLSGFVFQNNAAVVDELDIEFDPKIFAGISNGTAGSGFDVELFQPNNPPQAPGDYSALATLNHPSLTGPFTVDFTLINPSQFSSINLGQTYFINAFNNSDPSNPTFGSQIETGVTQPLSSGVPEPSSLTLCVACFLVGAVWAARHRLRPTPSRHEA